MKLTILVSPAESAKLKADAAAGGHRNVSAYIRHLAGLQNVPTGGRRPNSGRPPRPKGEQSK